MPHNKNELHFEALYPGQSPCPSKINICTCSRSPQNEFQRIRLVSETIFQDNDAFGVEPGGEHIVRRTPTKLGSNRTSSLEEEDVMVSYAKMRGRLLSPSSPGTNRHAEHTSTSKHAPEAPTLFSARSAFAIRHFSLKILAETTVPAKIR